MNKKIISIIISIALAVTLIVPAMAANGDNTGEDTFGWSVNIMNSSLLGDYTLGTEKIFKTELWTGTNAITNVTREIKITGVSEVTDIEFKDDESQWRPVSEFNVKVPQLLRDIGREFRVTFNTPGKYVLEFNIYNEEGKVILSSKKKVNVTETRIEMYVEPETTTIEATTIPEITTTPETTPVETTSEAPTADTTTTAETTTSSEIESETESETAAQETTTIQEMTTGADVETTSKVESDTTVMPETTTNKVVTTHKCITVAAVKLAKTKIKKASKSKASNKAKISIKKINKAKKYQVQIATTKKFKKKTILVKKTVKKVTFTIKSKKIKNKNKLYVRSRAYVAVGKNKYYGKWSAPKKVKIK